MCEEERPKPIGGKARPRPQKTGRGKPSPVSRPILIALALAALGAAFLFWPRGASTPTGIGEKVSVVTAEETVGASGLQGEPRSGDVTLDKEVTPLVPEQEQAAESRAAAAAPATDRAEPVTPAASSTEPRDQPPRQAADPDPTPPPPPIEPQTQGSWAIQLGAFGSEQNAEKLIGQLSEAGFEPRLRTANTSSGQLLFKVWIGFFATREDAAAYAQQHRRQLGDAMPVHR